MPRPKRRSDRVQFRLPVGVWPAFKGQAEQDGLSVSAYAELVVRRHVQTREASAPRGHRRMK